MAGHAAIAMKKAGQPAEAVRALHAGTATGNERLDAVAAFTKAVIASRGAVEGGDYQAFIAAGYNEQQAVEVVLGVSLATLCNFTNSLAGTPVNPQLAAFLPGAF
jgi:alkylhydroperoxidase family enzyme